MEPRLTSAVLVSALLRRAEVEGGFGAVLAKGDPTSGAVALLLLEKGRRIAFLERMLRPDGSYGWRDSGPGPEEDEAFAQFLERRRRVDPDLWLVELDIASAERFADEINLLG